MEIDTSVPVASSASFCRILAWVGQEYERLESENRTLKAKYGNGDAVDSGLRAAASSVGVKEAASPESVAAEPIAMTPLPGALPDESCNESSPTKVEVKEAFVAGEPLSNDEQQKKQAEMEKALSSSSVVNMPAGAIFHNLDEMKVQVKEHLKEKPVYKVEDFYKRSGIASAIATNVWFDNGTFAVIAVNALWIAVDTDYNDADILLDAHPVFMTAEQLFCFFFVGELFIRFSAFQVKMNCFKDAWFVFDLCLVTLMVLETWVLTLVMISTVRSSEGSGIGNASILKMAKMLRVVRMLRVARLMRSCPEFFILMKAISSASRATFFTCAFLGVVIYIYGIAFTLILKGTETGDELFPRVGVSMQTLFFQVTLGDGIADVTQSLLDTSIVASFLLATVIVITTITLMNTLIGVLCEAIGAVADKERSAIQIAIVEATLRQILEAGDTDHDGSISKDEFGTLIGSRAAVLALEDIGIDVIGMAETADYFFEEHLECGGSEYSKRLTFDDFMILMLQLRGSNKATVKDVVDLRKHMHKMLRNLEKVGRDVASLMQAQNPLRLLDNVSPLSPTSASG